MVFELNAQFIHEDASVSAERMGSMFVVNTPAGPAGREIYPGR